MPYTFLEHTADIRMEVFGESLEEVFSSALEGMTEAIGPIYSDTAAKKVRRELDLHSIDATTLLIDFLSEVLFLIQEHKECYEHVEIREIDERTVKAILKGRTITKTKDEIKGVTFHDADLVQDQEGTWRSVIVFDV
jgi:SHS2 domain-containing protein